MTTRSREPRLSTRSRATVRGSWPKGMSTTALLGVWHDEIEDQVLTIRQALIAQAPPPVEWMFDWTYADPPAALAEQRREVLGA